MRAATFALLALLLAVALPGVAEARWPADAGTGAGINAVSFPCGGPFSTAGFNFASWSSEWNDMRPGEILLHEWQTSQVNDSDCVDVDDPHPCCTGNGMGDCTTGHDHDLHQTDTNEELWADRFEVNELGATAPDFGHGLGSFNGGVGELGTFQTQLLGADTGIILMSESHGAAGGAYLSWNPDGTKAKTFVLVMRLKIEAASDQNFFVGLAEGPATTLLTTAGAMGATQQYIGFHHQQTDGTNVDFVTRWSNDTETRTENVFQLQNDQFFELALVMDQSSPTDYEQKFYWRKFVLDPDWNLGATHTPTTETLNQPLRLTFAHTGDSGPGPSILWLDLFCWAMKRT